MIRNVRTDAFVRPASAASDHPLNWAPHFLPQLRSEILGFMAVTRFKIV